MTSYAVVSATAEHAEELARTMRAADVAELADVGHKPHDALVRSLSGSMHAYAALIDGSVAAIWGVWPRSAFSSEAFPWMLCSDLAVRHPKAVHAYSTAWVVHVKAEFKWLHNYVSPRNVVAIRWLTRLGFEVSEELTPFGPKGALMRHFEMRT